MSGQDLSIWQEVGKAIAYVLGGMGTMWSTLWGIQRLKPSRPSAERMDPLDKLGSEVDILKAQVASNSALLKQSIASGEKYEKGLERIHARIDEMADRLARMEGRMERNG